MTEDKGITAHDQSTLRGGILGGDVGANSGNLMRNTYRQLSDAEKANMQTIKAVGGQFHDLIAGMGNSREISIAKTKVEEAVMWAVKGITG